MYDSFPSLICHTLDCTSTARALSVSATPRLAAVVSYNVGSVHLAAGMAISKELGLKVTDDVGDPLDLSAGNPWPVMIAAWPDAHTGLMKLMR